MPDQSQRNFWTRRARLLVFALAASSIACLLFDFYGLCSMRTSTFFIFLPAVACLIGLALADWKWGNRQLWHGLALGLRAGFLAAIAYDIFRLPFVFARQLGIESFVPPMNLFKVFPRFGAMILGQPLEQETYSLAAHGVGWIYHFSNGITFGIMYVALVSGVTRRSWTWGIVMALGLELGMLFTPYPGFFNIPLSVAFVLVTVAAHTIFGAVMGLIVRRSSLTSLA